MGQPQSKDELLYKQVVDGNVEAIKVLRRDGASLEWIDQEGKTPLIVACMSHDRFIVAQTLIELGANVNAYRPGRRAGSPLHHAVKRGLNQTVQLLLSCGANPLVRNDDCQTPVDVARMKGFTNVVRTIENNICLFSGWLRELYGPGLLEALAPQLFSRKIWAVILPSGPCKSGKPLKLELIVYSTLQDAQPRVVIALWKANIEELNFNQPDPILIISNKSTKARYKFAAANNGDKLQLQWFYNACRGIPQVMPQTVLDDSQASVPAISTQASAEARELAMGANASIHQCAMESRPSVRPNNHLSSEENNANDWGNTTDCSSQNGWGSSVGFTPSQASSNGWMYEPAKEVYNGWGGTAEDSSHGRQGSYGQPTSSEASSSGCIDAPAEERYNGWGTPDSKHTSSQIKHTHHPDNIPPVVNNSIEIPTPSAPLVPEEGFIEGPIHYLSIDFSPVDMPIPSAGCGISGAGGAQDVSGSSSCVICWDAPVEGACIPCGHMAGCMGCLNEIKAKKGECPVCRAKVDRIIRLYAV